MKYRDIIREMESHGQYSDADELRRSMDRHNVSDYDSVRSRNDARDGLPFSSCAASCAERAFDNIRSAERLEESRREEEERQHKRSERRRAEEEEYY